MAVEIFKVENGSVTSTHVDPHDLRNHLDNGWLLEIPKAKTRRKRSESADDSADTEEGGEDQ